MTTYILHGGNTKKESTNNELFFKRFTESVPKKEVTILLCYWARDKKTWGELFERDKNKILAQTNKQTRIQIASTLEQFPNQLKESDVLYISGGEEEFLRPYMSKLYFLKSALQGKVYIGSSMGAFLAAQNYVLSLSDQNTDVVLEGLGLLPVNVLCHWNIEKDKNRKIKLLQRANPDTPILTLDEERYSTFIV